jgi:hypothetical protein
MVPDEIRRKRDELALVACRQVCWCDDQALAGENMPGVGPGGDVNPFGWYVVGTTGGGNGIVVRADDPGVYFADHECRVGCASERSISSRISRLRLSVTCSSSSANCRQAQAGFFG